MSRFRPVVSLPITTAPTVSTDADSWGRQQRAVDVAWAMMRLRWSVTVGGDQHLVGRRGARRAALLVVNGRRNSMNVLVTALALSEATGRAVRFAGRPDVAPIGAALQRLGGILANADDVDTALAHGELVLVSAGAGVHPRHAGDTDPAMLSAAVIRRAAVHPVACLSSPWNRRVRLEVGPAVQPRAERRGPLDELERAEAVQRSLQGMLDTLGGLRTGVAPIDWIARG
jgi:hypothetical protein